MSLRQRLGLGLGLLMMSVFTMMAQGGPGGRPPGGPHSAKGELSRLTTVLSLTEAQQAAILPILEKEHSEMDTLMANGAGREANESKMHAIHDETRTAVKALLTEDQAKAYDAMHPPKPPSGSESDGSGETKPQGPPPDDGGL